MRWEDRHAVLGVAFLAFFATIVARLAVSPLVPDVIEAFGVSKSAVGLALSGMWAAYALLQFPSGVLGERFGERRVILIAVAGTAAGSALLAVAPNFAAFAAFAVVLGAGAGLYFSPATSLLTGRFEDTGGVLGLHSAGGPVGGLVAPVVAAFVGVRFGWRAGIAVGAAVAVPVLALAAWRIGPTPPARPGGRLRDRLDPRTVGGLLARPPVAYTTGIAGITMFTWQSFSSFFPTFLIEHHGFTTGTASLAFGASFVLSAVGLPVLGRLSDRFGRDPTLAFSLSTTGVGFALSIIGSGAAVLAGIAVLGVGMSWGGVLQSRFMDAFADDERGTGFGLVRTAYVLLGSTGSVAVGTLAETAGWPAAYGLVVGLLGVAVAAIVANRLLGLGL